MGSYAHRLLLLFFAVIDLLVIIVGIGVAGIVFVIVVLAILVSLIRLIIVVTATIVRSILGGARVRCHSLSLLSLHLLLF